MYCYNCHKFFPDDDIVREADGETAAFIYCCPWCGVDDIGESEECSICGKEFPEGEISHGFCLACLWEAIDYDTALDYMKSKKGHLAQFIIEDWFGSSIGETSDNLDKFFEATFRRLVAEEKLSSALTDKAYTPEPFLTACRFFCLPYYLPYYNIGEFGIDGQIFAEWFEDYTKKKKEAKP